MATVPVRLGLRSGLLIAAAVGACSAERAPPAAAPDGGALRRGAHHGATDPGCGLASVCDPGMNTHTEPGAGGWMPDSMNSSGVGIDPDGWLILGGMTRQARAAWVANSSEGTVSKLELSGNCEVARYPSVRNDGTNGGRPWNEWCNWSDQGNCPSRTSVDQNFDAYVANRAFGRQPTVTKYANDVADCVDRNRNGTIETSTDINMDCRINMGDPREFVGNDDECILWTRDVGPNNGIARALAVGLSDFAAGTLVGDPWVGLYNTAQVCRLDQATGATEECVDTGLGEFYGCATGPDGNIWCVRRTGGTRAILGRVQPGTPSTWADVSAIPGGGDCTISYGISFDADGRIFIANSDCDPNLRMYEPRTDTWFAWNMPRVQRCQWELRWVYTYACDWWGCGWGWFQIWEYICYDRFPITRGVAADLDTLWVAVSHECDSAWWGCGDSNAVGRYRLSDMAWLGYVYSPIGRAPVGVGVAQDGSMWSVGSNSVASRFDPATGAWIERNVGAGPYTYSDFIGFGLNTFAEPRGYYQFTLEGCNMGGCALSTDCPGGRCLANECILPSQWRQVLYTAEIPANTYIQFMVRTADTQAALATEPWIGPFAASDADTPVDLLAAPGPVLPFRFIEVQVVLGTNDRTVRPRIRDLSLEFRCDPQDE